ncbi:MAG: DUF349 domain-containing protein [Bacteroidota bacterium]
MNDQLNQNPLEPSTETKDEHSVSEDTQANEMENKVTDTNSMEPALTENNATMEEIPATEPQAVISTPILDEVLVIETETRVKTQETIEPMASESNVVAEFIPVVESETVSAHPETIELLSSENIPILEEVLVIETETVLENTEIKEAVAIESHVVSEDIPAVEPEAGINTQDPTETEGTEPSTVSEIVAPEKMDSPLTDATENAKRKRSTKKVASSINKKENSELASSSDSNAEDDEHELEMELNIDFSALSKIELIEKLEELVKTDHISKIKAAVSGIKVAYLAVVKDEKQKHLDNYLADGGTKEEYVPIADSTEERYKTAFDIYKEKKTKDDYEQDKIKLQNLIAKKQILDEIKVLVNSEESLKRTYDDFKLLQDKWKQIGMVPRNEIEGLWNNYHFLVEEFFKKVKISKELKDLDLKKNLELKVQLCEKAEELLVEKSITKSFKLLQKYHDDWKEIGPVTQDKKDEIWERFKNVSDKINSQRQGYYDNLHIEQENNLLAKTALCEKIEELNSVDIINFGEWKEKTEQVIQMQKLWDSIGRATSKSNDEIWDRFRAAINTFYNTKKEYFGELKDSQYNNYNLKLEICLRAEELANSTNWRQATADILKMQLDWKEIGPVPKRYSDKIWRRFRTACDVFFKNKSNYFKNINGIEQENLKKKEELIERINTYAVSGNKNENLDSLKAIQREWMEIGHVPMDVKEKLQNVYRLAINGLMDKLKISSTEVSTMHYKNRIESMQNSPDAGRFLSKERLQIEGRITMLKNDVNLWENNIGFLASSKKANLLKKEFEKKINDTKQELALLEAKLKLLARQ